MKIETRQILKDCIRVTTTDERWYIKDKDIYTSSTWIASYVPSKELAIWMAKMGWDEAEFVKREAGAKGSRVHKGCEILGEGGVVHHNDSFSDGEGDTQELTAEEYEGILSFKAFCDEVKPEILATEQTVFNKEFMYAGTLDAIMKIHDAEPCRIKRSLKVCETLLTLPKINTYLAMNGEDVAGYLVFGEGTNKPDIIEGGGSLQGLEALVGYVLTKHAKQEINVMLPIIPTKLGQLLEIKNPTSRQNNVDDFQMIRINSLEKLLRGIEGHLRCKSAGIVGEVRLVCKESGHGLTMKFRDGDVSFSSESVPDEIVLTRRELVQLIFGVHQSAKAIECKGDAGKILQKLFPYYCPVWVLDRS